VRIGTARAGDRDEVLDLLARWYDDRDFFARYHHDPAFRDDLCLVARDNGRIVSSDCAARTVVAKIQAV